MKGETQHLGMIVFCGGVWPQYFDQCKNVILFSELCADNFFNVKLTTNLWDYQLIFYDIILLGLGLGFSTDTFIKNKLYILSAFGNNKSLIPVLTRKLQNNYSFLS